MTVLSTDNSKVFTGSGSTGPFTWTWRFLSNSDISVTKVNITTGEETPLVEGTDYTLTGAGSFTGGSITLTVALSSQYTLVVERNTPILQEVSIRNQGNNFRPEVHEDIADHIVMSIQDYGPVGSVTTPVGEPSIKINSIGWAERAGKVLGFNALGQLCVQAANFVTSSGLLGNPWADVRGYDSFEDAIVQLAGTSIDLVVPDTQAVTDDLVVPANIRLVIKMGGLITVSAGKTLTINSVFEASPRQVFSGLGTVVVTAVSEHYPEWHGVTDLGATLNNMMNAMLNGGAIRLTAPNYSLTTPAKFPLSSKNIKLFSTCGSVVTVSGSGDCLDLTATNENYGSHTVEGLTLVGPNVYYSDQMANSDGCGIRIQRAYDTANWANTGYNNIIRDCTIRGFKYGIRMQCCIKNRVEGKTMITQNQYGIYIDGGATNANNFNNVVIRLNSVAGIYSSGAVAGGNNATNNTFMGCIIESNGAYNGGAAGTRGTGIRLNNSYDFVFVGCYSENQQYSIYLASSSKGNKFFSHRTANGGFGNDAIIFDGAGIWDNTFTNCKASNDLATDVNFISNHADQHNNIMRDCEGYNFIAGSVTAMPDVFNMNPMPSNVYSGVGKIQMPQHGYLADVEEGTTAGRLEGIGTTTATLHTGGFGEIQMGGQVAAAGTNTTITTFTGLKPGQIFTLWNYQATRTVTIKSGTVTDDIVLKNATNATMNNYGQMIVFYVNGLGRAYEIGRNF